MISRKTERFVNELHQLKREFRASNELLKEESKEERVCVTKREKCNYELQVKLGQLPSSWKQDADPIIHHVRIRNTCVRSEPFIWMRKSGVTISANYRRRSDLAIMISKQVTSMCRHFHHENSVNRQVCTRWSARFQWWRVVTTGSRRQHKEKKSNFAKTKMESLCYLGAVKGHSGGIAVNPKIMGYFLISQHWKKYFYHRGRSWDCQSVSGI